ncbi:carbohydrate-binding domain-containing protein [Paenibacillus turpanensis]|uniref:carbohydrate-binding domain-containing protein n=1 Tax=Paenibacillus turpanensis TaxID=2689078 RepID=UPI00140B5FDC|nr:carbohydrate-binding domain-containing protein [Paenibacillus turpanensis]
MNKITAKHKLSILLLSAAVLAACSNTAAQAPNEQTTAAAVNAGSGTATSGGTSATAAVGMTKLGDLVEYEADDVYSDYANGAAAQIQLNGTGAAVQGTGVEVKGGEVRITAPGTYVVSGALNEGQLVIDSEDKGVVRVVLNGVTVHNSSSAAIYVKKAGKAVISLPEGTVNQVSDGKTYVYADASTDEPNAAIFSDADLTFNGSGKLVVNGNFNNGITSKDDLKIMGGTYEIHAEDDALMGRDLVAVKDGRVTIEAGGDGIKSTYDTDTTKGSIALEAGSFHITSGSDGIQSANSIWIEGGTYSIVSGGGSAAVPAKVNTSRGSGGGESVAAATETGSAKGMKATANLVIKNGTFTIDSADDSIHTNSGIAIDGGQIEVTSGDDGIHADASIAIAGGTIRVAKSYEGIESGEIFISGGEVSVTASDDGINVSGGNDGSAVSGRAGQNQFSSSASNKLMISGGQVFVDSNGDGLDANGSIEMSGGTVMVSGPTSSGNGALDYDQGFVLSGGQLITAGSAGMAQGASDSSTQNSIMMQYSQTQKAGTIVHLEDSKGNTIVTFAPQKNYQAVVISTPKLSSGSYTLYSGGTATGSATNGLYGDGSYQGGTKIVTFEVAKSVTWLNESGVTEAGSGRMGGGRGGMGGGGMGRP